MRASGILLPVSSLPSKYGIGCFSEEAYEFVDQLARAGQKYWQILPLGPTGYGDSPYQSFSTFAGNPYFIDLEAFVKEGYLDKSDCEDCDWGTNESYVDYEKIYNSRFRLLRKAFENYDCETDQEYRKFVKENAAWLEDYSLYMAIKDNLNGISWIEWPTELKNREKAALAEEREKLAKEVGFYCFQQFCFFKQWTALKAYANAKGVEMIGDIPIYVAFDSADAWAQPELFQFDKENIPIGVAGCPPDAFSATGQLWGNPLYDWEYHKKTGYAWWIRRMANCMKLYDVVRIDHFRGFDEYYSIPYGDKTAQFGHWEKGPGMDLFRALEKNLGKLDVIAEDLGLLTDSVIEMVEESGFPGMKVLQFAFDENEDSPYLTHRYERNCIVYTGTHDNETTRGWFRNLSQHDRNFARAYIGCEGKHETAAVWSMIRAAMSSVADRCVIPVQDYLCLGNEARINEPSTLGDNWKWRMKKGQLNETIIQKIYKMTKLYGRLVKEETEEKEKTEADREKISDK
jgi:4-alpha-glucanotransferase